jgi:hypothetical protein
MFPPLNRACVPSSSASSVPISQRHNSNKNNSFSKTPRQPKHDKHTTTTTTKNNNNNTATTTTNNNNNTATTTTAATTNTTCRRITNHRTIKLFPAQKYTAGQLRELKDVGDFGKANICPSGGIDNNNAAEWLAAGAFAVGMGSCLAGRDIKIADGDSEEFRAATERWANVDKPAAVALAQRLGLSPAAAP